MTREQTQRLFTIILSSKVTINILDLLESNIVIIYLYFYKPMPGRRVGIQYRILWRKTFYEIENENKVVASNLLLEYPFIMSWLSLNTLSPKDIFISLLLLLKTRERISIIQTMLYGKQPRIIKCCLTIFSNKDMISNIKWNRC